MKRTIYFAWLFVTIVLLVPSMASAQTCFFVGRAADGRVMGPYSLSSASDDISLTFSIEAGRSYSVQAVTQRGPSGAGSLGTPEININSSFCPNTDIVSASVTIRDTTSITPNSSNGFRRSIVVTAGAPSFLEVRIHNTSASASSAEVVVAETTMFSPRWSTFAGFFTSYAFQNTTNSTINGTLTVRSGTGAVVGTQNFVIMAGQVGFTDTIQMGVGANDAGSATFVHDGPPGAIIADGFIQNFNVSPPVIQPVKFEAPREAGH